MLIEWDPDENVWVTYVPTPGQLSTYGDTRAEALEQTREAITGYLEAAASNGIRLLPADADAEVVEKVTSSLCRSTVIAICRSEPCARSSNKPS